MKLIIKNMVCNRCIMVVEGELKKLGLHPLKVTLGEVELKEELLSEIQLNLLDKKLVEFGFSRIDDRISHLIEKIKILIIQIIHQSDSQLKSNWSELISADLNYEYNYLSNLFSTVEGITIEQFIIRQKTEKVKELLIYDELSLSEIAWKLGFSNVAHASSQFKKVTGFTPTQFKKLIVRNRKSLDNL